MVKIIKFLLDGINANKLNNDYICGSKLKEYNNNNSNGKDAWNIKDASNVV